MNTRFLKVSIFFISAVIASISLVSSVDDKCAACNAVAVELGLGANWVNWRLDFLSVSDLRVVELLDGLCDKMQDYALEKLDSSKQAWVKVKNWDNIQTDKREARASSKDISSFCGRLLEETEDELAELIKRGSVQSGGVSKALCQDLSKHCSKTRGSSDTDDKEL